jgi:molecular chaperone GrpE
MTGTGLTMSKNTKHDRPAPDPDPQPDAEVEADAEARESPASPPPAAPTPDDPAAALQTERDELFARLQRVSADYQNYIRRAQQSQNEAVELARGDVARRFITVLDHFDNALAVEPAGEEARALYDGVKIVRDELLRVLGGVGVEPIEAAVGDPFDPAIHEAMMRQPADDVAPGCVSMIMQTGYRQGTRTLRPAKVAVAPEAE